MLSVSIDLHHFSSLFFHSWLASMENASILSCSLYGSYSIFLIINTSCFVMLISLFCGLVSFYSPALSFMKFLCSSSQLPFWFYYSENPSPVGKLCHLASHLILQIAHECVEHHHLLADRPCQISTSAILPHTKLIIYSSLYSCISIRTNPLVLSVWWRTLPKELGNEVHCISQISLSPGLLTPSESPYRSWFTITKSSLTLQQIAILVTLSSLLWSDVCCSV